MSKIKCFLVCLIILAAVVCFYGCGKTDEPVTDDIFAMDTYMTLTAYGGQAQDAIKSAEDKILQLDNMLSTGDESSEIFMLNQSGKTVLSDETAFLIEKSFEAYNMSGGAFNPLVYPIMGAWGFTDKEFRVPAQSEITGLLELTDINRAVFDSSSKEISLSEGTMIDLGGIAKGYTSSCVMDIFREAGIKSACVSLGGNVQVLGNKPDGSQWKIAIRDPHDTQGYLGIIQISDKAVITSGAYERFFEKDGRIYHHIIDPKTGYPADSGIISSTIVCSDGTLADALSTAVYVMGLDEAEKMWKDSNKSFDMIILSDDDNVYITSGLKDNFRSEKYKVNILN